MIALLILLAIIVVSIGGTLICVVIGERQHERTSEHHEFALSEAERDIFFAASDEDDYEALTDTLYDIRSLPEVYR